MNLNWLAFLLIFIAGFLSSPDISYSQKKNDSLLKVINNGRIDTNTVLTLIELSKKNSIINPKLSMKYGQQGIMAAQKIGFARGLALAYLNVGAAYYDQSENQKASEMFQKSLDICQSINYKEGLSKSYNNLGLIYLDYGNYPQAFDYIRRSLKIQEDLNDKTVISSCYLNIGNVLFFHGNMSKSLEYFNKSLKICKTNNDAEGICKCYSNIGTIYEYMGDIDKALEYYNKSLTIAIANNDKYSIAADYVNIGIIYWHKRKYKEAIESYKLALDLFKDMDYKEGVAQCENNLAEAYISMSDYKQALKYSEEALLYAGEINNLNNKKCAYFNLSVIYDSLRDYKNALKYYILFSKTKDTAINNESQKRIIEMESKYRFEQKEKEIISQNLKIEKLEQAKEIENLKLYILTGVIFIIVIACIAIIYYQKKKIKFERLLHGNTKLLTDTELKNEKLKSLQLQKELEFKNKEIINFALHITEKNDFLEKLKAELQNSYSEVKPSELIQVIDMNSLALEKEKQEFEAYVENVSQSFFIKLRDTMPDITKSEERLSVLLKLNLSSKEIATVLNITPRSVEMSRYRLRKRFDLNKDENLYNFLNSL